MLTAPLLFLFCSVYSAQAAHCEVEVNGRIQASLAQHEGYGYFYQTLANSSQRVFTLKFTVKIDTTREDGRQRFLLLKESARSLPLRTVECLRAYNDSCVVTCVECLRANNDSCVITYNHTMENLGHVDRLTYHTTTFLVDTTNRDVCRLEFIIGVKVADPRPKASLKWNQKGDMYMLGVNISGFPLPFMNDDLRCDGDVLDSAIKTSGGLLWYCHKHQTQQLVVNNNIAPLVEPRKPSSLSDISVECNRPKSMAEDDISISSGVEMQLETDGLESSNHLTTVTYTSPQQPSSLHKPESLNELRF